MDSKIYQDLEKLFKKIDPIIEEYIGKKCPDFDMACPQCRLGLIYQKFKIELANELGNPISYKISKSQCKSEAKRK